jgi:hypothetical protein
MFVTDGTKVFKEDIQVGVEEIYFEGHINPIT